MSASHSKQKPFLKAYAIWLIATGFLFWDCLQSVSPAAMGAYWQDSFNIDKSFLGLITAVTTYSYGIMQIPAGLIDDYFGPKRPVIFALTIAVLGNIFLLSTNDPYMAIFSRFLIGIGIAFAYISTIKLISNWFPYSYIGIMIGWTGVFGMIGGVSGTAPLEIGIEKLGWRETTGLLALIGIILILLFIFVVRNHPTFNESKNNIISTYPSPEYNNKTFHNFIHVLCNIQIWYSGIIIAGMNAILFCFGGLWGPEFFLTAHPNSTRIEANSAMSMIFLGAIPGTVFLGWISKKLKKRKLPLFISTLATFLLLNFIVYGPIVHISMTYIIMFCIGICCGSYVIAFGLANDNRPPYSTGIAIGFVNTCSVITCAILQHSIGLELDILNKGSNFTPYINYEFALSVLTGLLFLVLISACLLKETNCKPIFEDKTSNLEI